MTLPRKLIAVVCLLVQTAVCWSETFEYDGGIYIILSGSEAAFGGPKDDNTLDFFIPGTATRTYREYNNATGRYEQKTTTYAVTEIASGAFSSCYSLAVVGIPSTVEHIGDGAFMGSGLRRVNIPNSVVSLGVRCFMGCDYLREVVFGKSLVSVGKDAFSLCPKLEKVTYNCPTTFFVSNSVSSVSLSSNVSAIGVSSFYECQNLTSIDLPHSVHTIGSSAFAQSGITRINIPSSVTAIASRTFEGCAHLERMEIPASITDIEERAFQDCSGLTFISIPSSVSTVGSGAFNGCSSLASVEIDCPVIPDDIFHYEDNSYSFNGKLKEVRLGNSVREIGYRAFGGNPYLTDISFGTSLETIGSCAFIGCTALTALPLPNTVRTIGSGAFGDCTGLSALSIPDGVTTIESSAFAGCSGLETLSIPYSVKSISDDWMNGAFVGCDHISSLSIDCDVFKGWFRSSAKTLQTVRLGNHVQVVSDDAFKNFTALKTVAIGKALRTIGNRAFYECAALTEVRLPEATTTIGNGAFSGCRSLETVVFGKALETIGDEAFQECTALREVVLPDGVRTIGEEAFYHCQALTTARLGQSLQGIGNRTFARCGQLAHIHLPETLAAIGEYAFVSCAELDTLAIPNSVSDIGEGAFAYCSGIKVANIPNALEIIKASTFSGCFNLESITIPESVRAIGESSFFACSEMDSVGIPSSVATIGASAFAECESLKAVSLGSAVQAIGDHAFFSRNIEKVYCHAEQPAGLGTSVFPKELKALLYVPEVALDDYRSSAGWDGFFNQKLMARSRQGFFHADDFEPEGVTADGVAQLHVYYEPAKQTYTRNDPYLGNAKIRIDRDGEECTADKAVAGEATDVTWNEWDWGADYTAPDGFPEDVAARDYTLTFTMLDQCDGLVAFMGSRDVRVLRPGVMLIHGFRDNASCFQNLYSLLTSDDNDYEDWQVLKADYEDTNKAGLVTNAEVVKEHSYQLYDQLREHGILSGRYDYVGHSMGGLLARKYAQELSRDGVNRIITVNTPHSGSQMGTLAVGLGQIAADIGEQIPNRYVKLAVGALRLYVSRSGRYDAFKDLSPSSNAIQELNAHVGWEDGIPLHACCSYLTAGKDEGPGGQIIKEKTTNVLSFMVESVSFFVQDVMANPGQTVGKTILDNILEDNYHDGVVSLTSQKGGLPDGCVSIMSSEFLGWRGEESEAYHSNVVNSSRNISEIAQLLREPKTSAKFSRDGFKPVDLTISSPRYMKRRAETEFIGPSDRQFIKVSAAREGDTRILRAGLDCSDDVVANLVFMRLSDDVILAAGNEKDYRFEIPDTYEGTFTIYALGRTADNALVADTVMVSYESLHELDSLYFTVDAMSVEAGSQIIPEVTALWSNGKRTLIDPTFTTTDNALLDIDGMDIMAKAEGVGQLVARYKDKTAVLTVTVLPADPASVKEVGTGHVSDKVYTVTGTLVRQHGAASLQGLKPGIYIVNGKKVVVK